VKFHLFGHSLVSADVAQIDSITICPPSGWDRISSSRRFVELAGYGLPLGWHLLLGSTQSLLHFELALYETDR
jgi:hypothetical protein